MTRLTCRTRGEILLGWRNLYKHRRERHHQAGKENAPVILQLPPYSAFVESVDEARREPR